MAFTPINLSNALTSSPDGPSTDRHNERTTPSNDVTTTVASAYLGRGAKSRKRTSAVAPPSKTKRRQTSNIKDGLNVSKYAVDHELNIAEDEIVSAASSQAYSSRHSKCVTIASQSASIALPVSSAGDEPAQIAARPIPVYPLKTTMDKLATTSVPTSVESARASNGQGFTLYQGSSSNASYSSSTATMYPTFASKRHLEAAPKKRAAGDSDESASSNRRSARFSGVTVVQEEVTELQKTYGTSELPCTVDDVETDFSEIGTIDLAESNKSDTDIKQTTPPPRVRKLNTRDVDELEDYGGALLSDADRRALNKINAGSESAMKPIVRKPFPPSILDRSPIFGVSRGVVLRTCFRVGEATMTGCFGVRNGHDVVIELYARVTASWREPAPGRIQHFTFRDIYHNNPPYLEGAFALWQQAQLWDLESKVFLGASKGNGIMCRAVARMIRDGQKWRLDVLSVWEATWKDVNFAAGICTDAVGL